MVSGQHSMISQSSLPFSQNGSNQAVQNFNVAKSHSNENFNKQVIAINTSLLPTSAQPQKVTHHSP